MNFRLVCLASTQVLLRLSLLNAKKQVGIVPSFDGVLNIFHKSLQALYQHQIFHGDMKNCLEICKDGLWHGQWQATLFNVKKPHCMYEWDVKLFLLLVLMFAGCEHCEQISLNIFTSLLSYMQ